MLCGELNSPTFFRSFRVSVPSPSQLRIPSPGFLIRVFPRWSYVSLVLQWFTFGEKIQRGWGLRFSDEGLVEKGLLILGVCFLSMLVGFVVLAWYRELEVQVCWVWFLCVGYCIAYSLLCLCGLRQEFQLFQWLVDFLFSSYPGLFMGLNVKSVILSNDIVVVVCVACCLGSWFSCMV